MTEFQIGQVLKDNDPRKPGRTVTITFVGAEYVVVRSGSRTVEIRKDRVFTDGKVRRTGFSLVS